MHHTQVFFIEIVIVVVEAMSEENYYRMSSRHQLVMKRIVSFLDSLNGTPRHNPHAPKYTSHIFFINLSHIDIFNVETSRGHSKYLHMKHFVEIIFIPALIMIPLIGVQ